MSFQAWWPSFLIPTTYEACKMWSTEFKDKILSRPEDSGLVIRPDSGDPVEVLEDICYIIRKFWI